MSKTVLFVIPHEDDGEGGGGGSAAMWSSQGDRVVFVLCTNGDKGTSDFSMTPKKLAQIRNKEQIEAASILGVKEVVFLDYGDGELEDTMELRGKITRQIRIYRPDIILAIDPFRRKVHQHRDHHWLRNTYTDHAVHLRQIPQYILHRLATWLYHAHSCYHS